MFMEDSDELWDLLYNLDEKTLKRLEVFKFTKELKKGIREFKNELKELYAEMFIGKNPRSMHDAFKIEALVNYYKTP